jgi:hypothetical protein
MVIAPLTTACINAALTLFVFIQAVQIITEIRCRLFSACRFRQAGCVSEAV